MKTNRLLILCLGLWAVSCNKDSSPAAISPAQAKQSFMSVNTDLSAEINGLNSAPGNVALNSISNLTNVASPFGRVSALSVIKPSELKRTMTRGLSSIHKMLLKASASERVQDSQPFDFTSKVGVYTWDHSKKRFSKTGSSNIIKIDYPTDTASTTNNAELQITVYQEQQLSDGSWNPTSFDAAIYVASIKQTELKFTAGYTADGSTNLLDLSIFISPYTITLGFDDTRSTSATESFSYSKSSKVLIETSITATFASASDKANNKPSAVSGHLQLENVKFDINIDGSKAATSNNANDYVVIAVTVDGGTAGHVVWVTDQQTGQQEPYVQYNDKTQEPLKTLFADLADQLQHLFG